MPLTARCHSLRPERSSGWLAFFELVPRGGRAAHFLVVGPADNTDRTAHEVALRGAQAAVRYLKEVPGQAPASTILDAIERLLRHEAREAGTDIEFGCAVLEHDHVSARSCGRVHLLQLSEDRGHPHAPSDAAQVAVSEGERYFFGRLPRGAGEESISHDFLARVEQGGGGDGGLILTLTRSGEHARLDLAPPDAARRPVEEGGEPEPAQEAEAPRPSAEAPSSRSERSPEAPTDAEDAAGEDRSETAASGEDPAGPSARHEWKTVKLPPRPEKLALDRPGERGETLPMGEDVDLSGSRGTGQPPDVEAGEEVPEPFSDMVTELQDVFIDPESEEKPAGDTRPVVEEGDEEPPREEVTGETRAEPPREAARDETQADHAPRVGDLPGEDLPPLEIPDEELSALDMPEEKAGEDERPVEEAGVKRLETPLQDVSGPQKAAADRELYAPEETRGLGFWLAVVAAVIALGAMVVYLTLVRPRLAGEPAEETAAPAAPTGDAETAGVLDPAEPTLQWSQTLEGPVTSSPLVAGRMVIFGCRDGRVYALDRATGRREWAYAAPDGFGSSPALAGDLVVIGGYDGRLYGLDLATGEERWNHDMGGRIVASPAVDDEFAYVGAYNHAFHAVSLADGSLRWSRDLGSVQWASPATMDDVVVTAGLDGVVTALDRTDGRILWQARTGGEIYSSPVIAERKVIVGAQDGALHAFDLASGEAVWTVDAGSAVDGSPGYHEGRVVVGTNDGVVLGVDVGLGRIVWRVATGGEVKSRPAFRGRLAWLTGYDGSLHGIEWLTGAEAARYPIDSSAYSSPAIGDGTAYFGTMDGRFLAVHLGGAAP